MKVCSKCRKKYPTKDFTQGRVCRLCRNVYNLSWKHKNRERLSAARRLDYALRYKSIAQAKELERKKNFPLRVRCQILRSGMRNRAKDKNLEFASDFFTVSYLMSRLSHYPYCECCKKLLDLSFKTDKKFNDNSPSMDRVDSKKGYTKYNVAILCWRCNKHKQDASASELRMIANWMEGWKEGYSG